MTCAVVLLWVCFLLMLYVAWGLSLITILTNQYIINVSGKTGFYISKSFSVKPETTATKSTITLFFTKTLRNLKRQGRDILRFFFRLPERWTSTLDLFIMTKTPLISCLL